MQEFQLRDGTPVEILGYGPLSKRFKEVLPQGETKSYLVFAENLRYRFDDADHPKDIIEVKE